MKSYWLDKKDRQWNACDKLGIIDIDVNIDWIFPSFDMSILDYLEIDEKLLVKPDKV